MKQAFEALRPKVVLGIAAHPDDLDFGASGTIAKWAREGAAVYYLILTDGSKGSEDRDVEPAQLIEMRREEQRAAGKIVGVKDIFFLDYPDGELENTLQLKRDIARYIRSVRPDVVITMDPSVLYAPERGIINHPDHRAAGQAALDAVFPLARDHMTFPELLVEGYEPHKVSTVLLVNLAGEYNYVENISDSLELKLQALAAHVSQVPDVEGTHRRVTEWAKRAGKPHGHNHAEAFVRIDIV